MNANLKTLVERALEQQQEPSAAAADELGCLRDEDFARMAAAMEIGEARMRNLAGKPAKLKPLN